MAYNRTPNSLSHDEIWDDSILVDTWNAALQEYKKYHSIKAQRNAESDDDKLLQEQLHVDSQSQLRTKTDDAVHVNEDENMAELEEEIKVSEDTGSDNTSKLQESKSQIQTLPGAFPPEIQDEALKSLMMSWYYAGYYTGLYEGQQQAQQQKGL